MPAGLFLVVVLLVALVCGVGGGLAGGVVGAEQAKPTPTKAKAKATEPTGKVVNKVLPSVVKIESDGAGGKSIGSGFVYKGNYILTNNHVVENAADGGDVKVRLHNGDTKSATVKGTSATFDVAVLEVQGAGKLPPVKFANSDKAAAGDQVIAIGAPLNLAETTTTGIVSAVDRPVPFTEEAVINSIQIDASVNPGNSGGPLFDAGGKVLGITYAGKPVTKYERGSNGLNFVIPERIARRTADQIISTEKSSHAVMGTTTDADYEDGGAKIVEQSAAGKEPVVTDGPADKAGLEAGDIITRFDGKQVDDAMQMVGLVRASKPNSAVKLVYERSGAKATTKVTLGEEDDDS